MINWDKLASPQDDFYDTFVILDFATQSDSLSLYPPYRRQAPQKNELTIFDGQIAVRHIFPFFPFGEEYLNAPADWENTLCAEAYVRSWPNIFIQFQILMDTFNPIRNSLWSREKRLPSMVSDAFLFGSMIATTYDPLILAECFVYELARNKLISLGIGVYKTKALLLNKDDYLTTSLYKKPRLVSAVFHSLYSTTHSAQLDICILESSKTSRLSQFDRVRDSLNNNLNKIEEEFNLIKTLIHLDSDGEKFFLGFSQWYEQVVKVGRNIEKKLNEKH